MTITPTITPAVGLIGVHGYGAVHLNELGRLSSTGRAKLVACADVRAPSAEQAEAIGSSGTRYFEDWRRMLERAPAGAGPLDVVVVASPPHMHQEMALAAMEAGAHVLLEKPPTVTRRDFDQLVGAGARAGLKCQVGFQSTASGALGRARQIVATEELGGPVGLGAVGTWQRDRGYWTRSEWAGRATIGGQIVRDGAISNPFAHASMNCLVAAGVADGTAEVVGIEVERYRANQIEVEDTASVRVSLGGGDAFVVAVTLCADVVGAPALRIMGPSGRASWPYERDTLSVEARGRSWSESFARRSLTEELVDLVGGRSTQLSCPLERCGAFVELVEAVHAAPVYEVPARWVRHVGSGLGQRPVITGVEEAVEEAVSKGRLFSELGVAWALGARSEVAATGHATGHAAGQQ